MFFGGRTVARLLAHVRGCGLVSKKAHYRKKTPKFLLGLQPQLLHGSSVATMVLSQRIYLELEHEIFPVFFLFCFSSVQLVRKFFSEQNI